MCRFARPRPPPAWRSTVCLKEIPMHRAAAGAAPAATPPHPARPPATRPLVGIVLLILSAWTLSCLDASGKWVMAAGVPLLILCWVRYLVHLLLVLALVLPGRGVGILRSRHPREQLLRGGSMLVATLAFFTTLSYMPQAEATAINFLAPLIVLALAPWVLKEPPRASRWVAAGVARSEEHTSELQSRENLVCRLLLEKKNT